MTEMSVEVMPQADSSRWLGLDQAQQAIASRSPRNEALLLQAALKELELSPEHAARAYYVIPYKKRGDDGSEETINVEGPSIKAAMALARRWGNQANGFRVASQTDERIVLEGIFWDAETNSLTIRAVTVSRFYIVRATKQRVPLREDKLNMAILSGGSKAVRNAILSGLPAYLVESYVKRAKQLAVSGGNIVVVKKDAVSRKDKMLESFSGMGVKKEAVIAYFDNLPTDKDEAEKLAHMIGIHNGIKDGQLSAEQVFGSAGIAGDQLPMEGEVKIEDAMPKRRKPA